MNLRFSIITPTLDRLPMLQRAVESLRIQSLPPFQHIVVDGGSRDGTVEWVRAQPDTTLIEGPDGGMYDGLNKGLAVATGDIIGYLNSDDVYEPSAFQRVAEVFAMSPTAASVAGIAVIESEEREIERIDARAELMLDPAAVLLGRVAPNPRFFRVAAARQVGEFDIALRYVADRDWLLRFAEAGFVTAPIEAVLYRFRQHEGSMTFDPLRRHLLAIRRDRMQLSVKWRSNDRASARAKRAAATLEMRMRLAIAHGAVKHARFREAAGTLLDPVGWMRLALLLMRRNSGPRPGRRTANGGSG